MHDTVLGKEEADKDILDHCESLTSVLTLSFKVSRHIVVFEDVVLLY